MPQAAAALAQQTQPKTEPDGEVAALSPPVHSSPFTRQKAFSSPVFSKKVPLLSCTNNPSSKVILVNPHY